MVLHDINLAAKFADFLIAIKDGKIISAGSPYEVMTKDVLRDVYNIDANIVADECFKHPVCMSYQLLTKRKPAGQTVLRGA
jgi:iron complex transport system ATP-binding protein